MSIYKFYYYDKIKKLINVMEEVKIFILYTRFDQKVAKLSINLLRNITIYSEVASTAVSM